MCIYVYYSEIVSILHFLAFKMPCFNLKNISVSLFLSSLFLSFISSFNFHYNYENWL